MNNNIKIAMTEIICAGRQLAIWGLISASSGNISCRLTDKTILITASGTNKGCLEKEDLLLIDLDGQIIKEYKAVKPSSEAALHLALYKNFPQISAIIHAHPPFATKLATKGLEMPKNPFFSKPLPIVPPLPAGSPELAQAVLITVQTNLGAQALLLAAHGALSWGESIDQALYRMEALEQIAITTVGK